MVNPGSAWPPEFLVHPETDRESCSGWGGSLPDNFSDEGRGNGILLFLVPSASSREATMTGQIRLNQCSEGRQNCTLTETKIICSFSLP